jgi:hypothetical protein
MSLVDLTEIAKADGHFKLVKHFTVSGTKVHKQLFTVMNK